MSKINLISYIVLNAFNRFLKEHHNIIISKKEAKDLLLSTWEQYKKHIEKHEIHVNAACPYKMLSWVCFSLAQTYKNDENTAKACLYAGVKMMRELLKERGIIIDNDVIIKLISMCLAEIKGGKEGSQVGVGKNGLYMSFKVLSKSTHIKK